MKRTLPAIAALVLLTGIPAFADNSALMQPVKSAYDHYLKIQVVGQEMPTCGVTKN